MSERSKPDQSFAVSKTDAQQMAELWKDLTQLICNVIEEMNRLDELKAKTGGLAYGFENNERIIIKNESMPEMYRTISLRPASIEVSSRILIEGAVALEQEVPENLAVYIDETGPLFRKEDGEALTIEQAVYYLLRPFLHLAHLQ